MFSTKTDGRESQPIDVALRIGIVVSALTTAAIHFSLGSLLYVANTFGYVVLAVALVAPIAIAVRFQRLTRLALIGFTMATIGGWLLFGARYDVAYLSKGIEVLMIVLLGAEVVRDGGARAIVSEVRGLFATLRRVPSR